jgi:Zn-dependent peptidase ImmA (M78 family)/transcriptional regulator with XRE-family HTH domain
MAASVEALVNRDLLVWAREQAGYDLEGAAQKFRLGKKSFEDRLETLRKWESGQERPSLKQAQDLAKLYKRPFTIFFLPQRPQDPPIQSEYRRLRGVKAGKESPELRFALRSLHRRREFALELLEENEEEPPRFELSAHLSEDPEIVGQRLRDATGITLRTQLGWKGEYPAWRGWRDAMERLGTLVFQIPGLELEEVRGVSLFLQPLPVVGVNSKESPYARPYTLLHEIAHLMLHQAGDEQTADREQRSEVEWEKMERFADAVAAAVLLPREALLGDPLVMEQGTNSRWQTETLQALARRFSVTPLAVMTRLVNLKLTTWDFYRAWLTEWKRQWANRPQKKQQGGPSRVETILSRVGPTFAALVLDSLERDLISPMSAADYLDLKIYHFENLKHELRGEPWKKRAATGGASGV